MPSDAEVIELKRRLEDHIADYRVHCAEEEAKTIRHEEMYEKNMVAIATLVTSTQGVVDAWVFANSFHRFIKWLSGFALLGAAITWLQHTFKG